MLNNKQSQRQSVVQPEIVASRASNVDAGNVETEGASNDPHVVLNDGDIVVDPGLRIPIKQMHTNIKDACEKSLCFECFINLKGSLPTVDEDMID
jgi:hypothetical protein